MVVAAAMAISGAHQVVRAETRSSHGSNERRWRSLTVLTESSLSVPRTNRAPLDVAEVPRRRELLVSPCSPTAPSSGDLAFLYDAGHLRALIDRTFPLDQTLEALAYVEQGRTNGQVVIALG
jgi:NADPH:quinone reductase-like Zn-dependent oxidoreductase